jgi:hypothetical protein
MRLLPSSFIGMTRLQNISPRAVEPQDHLLRLSQFVSIDKGDPLLHMSDLGGVFMAASLCVLMMSPIGTNRTSRNVRCLVAIREKADIGQAAISMFDSECMPKQIACYQALSLLPPAFAVGPLTLGAAQPSRHPAIASRADLTTGVTDTATGGAGEVVIGGVRAPASAGAPRSQAAAGCWAQS